MKAQALRVFSAVPGAWPANLIRIRLLVAWGRSRYPAEMQKEYQLDQLKLVFSAALEKERQQRREQELRNAIEKQALRLSPATPGSMRFDAGASQLPAGVTRPYAACATRV